jgi:hypothetical protein
MPQKNSPLGLTAALFLTAGWLLPGVARPGLAQIIIDQPATTVEPSPVDRPLPDIVALMRRVETNQRGAEAIQKDYTYHEATRVSELDSHGGLKKIETRDFEISYIDGVPVQRLVAKDGKPVPADELRKEDEKIQERVAKAKERRAKADAQDKETDSAGHEEITLSRMLELGAFTNPRRVQVNGRDTIAIDYTGDPKAKTRNQAEGAVKEMAGTIWVDEHTSAIEHLEGRFVNNFKVGGGLVINVSQGTSFKIVNAFINNEVWLPKSFEAHGHARVLLFLNVNGDVTAQVSNYKRFRASTRILPGVEKVDPDETPATPSATPPSPVKPPPGK